MRPSGAIVVHACGRFNTTVERFFRMRFGAEWQAEAKTAAILAECSGHRNLAHLGISLP